MTGLWFKLAANHRPVELRANVFATVGVGCVGQGCCLRHLQRRLIPDVQGRWRVVIAGPMNVECCLLNRVAATQYVDEMR